MLNGLTVTSEMLESVERQGTYFRIFEGDGMTLVAVVADSVGAHDLSGHVVAGDLIAPVFTRHHRLAGARANRIERRKQAPGTIERFALAKAHSRRAEPIDFAHRLGPEVVPEADLLLFALRAMCPVSADLAQHRLCPYDIRVPRRRPKLNGGYGSHGPCPFDDGEDGRCSREPLVEWNSAMTSRTLVNSVLLSKNQLAPACMQRRRYCELG